MNYRWVCEQWQLVSANSLFSVWLKIHVWYYVYNKDPHVRGWEKNDGPDSGDECVLPTEHSGAGVLNGLKITFFPHEIILALKKYYLRLFPLAGVDLSVPKVDHGTNCIQLLNGMRERMTVKTRNQTRALESL